MEKTTYKNAIQKSYDALYDQSISNHLLLLEYVQNVVIDVTEK